MLKNYFKIAFRNIRRYTGYTLINVVGLAVGIAVCVLIFQYVSHELSYDQYHSKSDRIYRITLDHPRAHVALTPSMFSPTIQRLFPEVETGVRLYDVGTFQPLVVRYKDRVFEERKVVYADSSLFDLFDFELLAGNSSTALVQPNTMILTRKMAGKYFGSTNPIGKTIEVNEQEYEVTGVMENILRNSHFTFDFFGSLATYSDWGQLSDDAWKAANFHTYIVLDEEARIDNLSEKVNSYIDENSSGNEFAESLDIVFEPLTNIHLYSDVDVDIAPQGDYRYVFAASAFAFIILIIACINYMNLATARSARRSREVGIRKVLGSDRRSLIKQFYGESALLTILAIAFTILLIELFLPWFNQITGQEIGVEYASIEFWGMMLGIGMLVTLVAGSYPALMLSSFKPSAVLKEAKVTVGNIGLRKFLVVFQFAASIFLIISTIVIYRQINFIQEKELGYKQDNVIALTAYNEVENRFNALKSELMQLPEVKGAAMTSETPTNIRAGYGPDVEGIEEGPNFIVNALKVTPDFTETLGIEIEAGRSFTRGDFTRANRSENPEYAIMVNEATAQHFGLDPEKLVGKKASIGGRSGSIVGIVKDFHFSSLHQPIEPLFLFPRDGFNKVLISLNSSNIQRTLGNIRTVWKQFFPQYPFEYEFLDQEYNALYQQEKRAGNIFTGFALLAIFVACLGLFGLASYMVERRTKEIGVRKVLGASIPQIMMLFSKDFVLLVLTGFLISLPIAWYGMYRWLQNFAYKIEIGYSVFILAGLLTLVIALLTVSYQAIRAARLNPAETLKNE